MQSPDVQKGVRTRNLALGHFNVDVGSRGVNKEPEKKMPQERMKIRLMCVTETKTGKYFQEE